MRRMSDYDIQLDVKYPHGTLIDVAAEAAAHDPWFNQTLTTVNDAVVRLGVIDGDFHWHKHYDTDEFFLVTIAEAPWLDGKHTVFGQVTGGMEAVDAIEGLATDARDKPTEPAVIERVELSE